MAINRSAEAMTICYSSGLFPIITWVVHGWRIGFAYTDQFGSLWVNFNSPLLWDVFYIYLFICFTSFWWTGLLPDFAMLRDRAITPFNKEFILY
jgi:molybdopterin-containing oxidoreductase family membrane subunit